MATHAKRLAGFVKGRIQRAVNDASLLTARPSDLNTPSISPSSYPTSLPAHRSVSMLALPIAHHHDRFYYVLYPVPISSQVPLPIHRSLIKDVLKFWKSGLWVLGRSYRAAWNALCMPDIYRHEAPSDQANASLIQRVKRTLYDASDRLVLKWSVSTEEDTLKSFDTHAQFLHHRQPMEAPLRKLNVFFPEAILSEKAFPVFTYHHASDPNHQIMEASISHLASLLPTFQSLYRRSLMFLTISVPIYAVWPQALLTLDETLALEWFTFSSLSSFVSLPLAYNLIRLFSYKRCCLASSFLTTILHLQKERLKIQTEMNRLRDLSQSQPTDTSGIDGDKKKNELDMNVIRDHMTVLEHMYTSTGLDITPSQPLSMIVEEWKERNVKWMDREMMRRIGKEYGLDMATFYRDMVKVMEKVKMMERQRLNKSV